MNVHLWLAYIISAGAILRHISKIKNADISLNFSQNIHPIQTIELCVISKLELYKCQLISQKLRLNKIELELICILSYNPYKCFDHIKHSKHPRLIVSDPATSLFLQRSYDLKTLAVETASIQNIYGIAIVKKIDLHTNLINLFGRKVCIPYLGNLFGWHAPLYYLKGLNTFDNSDDIANDAGSYWGSSCVPGSREWPANKSGSLPKSLCSLCYNGGYDKFCKRNHEELYYGEHGSLRCLTEGGGHVAFVSSLSVHRMSEYLLSALNDYPWNLGEFELLCPGGMRSPVYKYKDCNLMETSTDQIVLFGTTNEFNNEQFRNMLWNYINLIFTFARDNTWQMKNPNLGYERDLIFKDSSISLIQVARKLEELLGPEIVSMIEETANENLK